jgi:OLD-like protein
MAACLIVEGESDRAAIEALAARRDIDLDARGVRVVQLGGAHRIGGFLAELGRQAHELRLAGLCDAGEEQVFRRAMDRAGLHFGLYVCVEDLEDELIRALGGPRVEGIIRENDDLRRFRALQQMPQWRGRAVEQQLRRFMGSGGRRKIRYARLLVEGLDLAAVPLPLEQVLADAVAPA